MGTIKQAFLRFFFFILCAGVVFAPGCQDEATTDPLALGGAGAAYNPYNDPDNAAAGTETTANSGGSVYLVGSGIYDITGPAGEIVMMGFAVSEQKTAGIHMRLRSRAFVIGDD